MSDTVQTLVPDKVIVTFNGVPISGFADGTFVEVTAAADRYTKKVGADGEVARVRGSDDTSSVKITLMQSSLSNTVLTGFKETDRLTNKGIGPLSITDLSLTALFFWPAAWIKKSPDWARSKELGDQVWEFDTGQPGAEIQAAMV